MAKRIQLHRTSGWRKPEGAIVVSRPSLWGNPFTANEWGLDRALKLYRSAIVGWNPSDVADLDDERCHRAYALGCQFQKRLGTGLLIDLARATLRGYDLCCWCFLDEPCHADILLEIAND